MNNTPTKNLLLIIIAISTFLKLLGLLWDVDASVGYFEPDEYANTQIAKEFINSFDKKLIPDNSFYRVWLPWSFGIQASLLSYPFLKLDPTLSSSFITLTARLLSILYSLALIVLVYFISYCVFHNKHLAILSVALISIFDLTTTYSHYGTPDIAHVFWFYLSIFLMSILFYPSLYDHYKNNGNEKINAILLFLKSKIMPLTAFSVAMAGAIRFDVIPLILSIFLFTKELIGHNRTGPNGNLLIKRLPLKTFFFFILLVGFFFNAVHFFNYSPAEFLKATQKIIVDNPNPSDNYTPLKILAYAMVIVAGTSIPVFIFFVAYLRRSLSKKSLQPIKQFLSLLAIALLISYLILHFGPVITVRRMNIFLPFVAIITAQGMISFYESRILQNKGSLKLLLITLTLIYTSLLTIWSQSYFIKETRDKAEKFINENYKDKIIAYTDYANTANMPPGILFDNPGVIANIPNSEKTIVSLKNGITNFMKDRLFSETQPEILVMHETLYGRYWKSVSNTIKLPPPTAFVL